MQNRVGLKCTEQWIRATSNFIALIPTRSTRQILALFWKLNSKRLYQTSGKDKKSRWLVFTSWTKREIRHFHVVVVQRRQRNAQKSGVIQLQSCYFSNLKTYFWPIVFLPFSLPSQSSQTMLCSAAFVFRCLCVFVDCLKKFWKSRFAYGNNYKSVVSK